MIDYRYKTFSVLAELLNYTKTFDNHTVEVLLEIAGTSECDKADRILSTKRFSQQ